MLLLIGERANGKPSVSYAEDRRFNSGFPNMTKRVLILANNNSWTTWEQKLAAVRDFWKPFVDLSITAKPTSFKNIPLKQYLLAGGDTSYLVDSDWYQKNVVPLAAGYDFVVFCLSQADLKGQLKVPYGVNSGCFAGVNMITMFGGNEDWSSYAQGMIPLGNSFVLYVNHEISHGFFQAFNLPDNTHAYFYGGKPARIFEDLQPSRWAIKTKAVVSAVTNLVKQLNPMNNQTATSILLYNTAKAYLGTSLVPAGNDPELGCAISVNTLWKKVKGVSIGGGTSTYLLLQALKVNPAFQEVTSPLPGDIIISATGTSTKPDLVVKNGHVGVVAIYGVMSNKSATGLWSQHFTLKSWVDRYEKIGGFPTRYFRPL